MSLETYGKILHKIAPHAKDIHLYNNGEPFLNQNLIDLIGMTAAKRIRTTIHSNLNVRACDEYEADRIVKSGLSVLSASIDGASQETYGMYRIGGDFAKAITNLKQLRAATLRLKSKTPSLVWSYLVHRHNEHEIEKAITLANEIGVKIVFSLMNVWNHTDWESSFHKERRALVKLNRRVLLSGLKKGPDPLDTAVEIMKRIAAKLGTKSKRIRKRIPGRRDQVTLSPNLQDVCRQPFQRMVIDSTGRVLPCCTVCDDRSSLGNLLTEDPEALWNNREFMKCRDFLLHYDQKKRVGSVCELGVCGVDTSR
jgi:MoaA/NifB/PqqE/SkfB family radical SAM enzyme